MLDQKNCVCCGTVGINYLGNHLKRNQYPDASEKVIIEMGNGKIETDPDMAMETFTKENFEQIPHSFSFHPEVPIKNKKSIQENLVASLKTIQNIENETKPDSDPESVRRKLASKLKGELDAIKEPDTTVFPDWKDKDMMTNGEEGFFFIVSGRHKMIIHFEIVIKLNEDTVALADKNFKKSFSLFQEKIPFLEADRWQHIRMIIKKDSMKDRFDLRNPKICRNCEKFAIDKKEMLWSKLRSEFGQLESPPKSETFKTVMKYLLYETYRQELGTYGTSDKPRKFILLNKDQASLLHDNQKRMVVLTGPFGTGKSLLLRAKTRQLLEQKQKVIFICFCASDKTILKLTIQNEFRDFHEKEGLLEVMVLPAKAANLESDLKSKIDHNENCNFIFDEIFIGTDGIGSRTLNEISKMIAPERHLWIACQSDTPTSPNPALEEDFVLANLTSAYRYSENMLLTIQHLKQKIGSKGWPHCPQSQLNSSSIERSSNIVFSLQPDTSLSFAIDSLVKHLNNEKSQTIIRVEIDEGLVLDALGFYLPKERIIIGHGEDDLKEFIESEEKILVVTSKSEFSLRGFEVETVVLITNSLDGSLNQNIISACKSKLILVCQEERSKKMLEVFERDDKNLFDVIQVFDLSDDSSTRTGGDDTSFFIDISEKCETNNSDIDPVGKTNRNNTSCLPTWRKYVLAVVVVIILIIVGIVFGIRSDMLGGNCGNDNFTQLLYNVRVSVDGRSIDERQNVEKHLRFRLLRGNMTFEKATEQCKNEHSELWDVESKEEWAAMLAKLTTGDSTFPGDGVWLNGWTKKINCSIDDCSENKAKSGQGLTVHWISGNNDGSFSRLYSLEDVDEEKYIYVEGNSPHLWTWENYTSEEHQVICVKRHCPVESTIKNNSIETTEQEVPDKENISTPSTILTNNEDVAKDKAPKTSTTTKINNEEATTNIPPENKISN